jgi:hypothetical protein
MTDSIHDKRASRASPPAGNKLDPDTPIETTEQLRIAIDRGQGGDKVDASDPAAAPLGTDDEAGGTPNSAAQVRLAAAHEVRARPNSGRQRTSGLGHAWWLIGLWCSQVCQSSRPCFGWRRKSGGVRRNQARSLRLAPKETSTSDYRDARGGAHDHVKEFGKPQPQQVKDKQTPHRKQSGALYGPGRFRARRELPCRTIKSAGTAQ